MEETKISRRHQEAFSLMEEKLECVYDKDRQTGEEYLDNYMLGNRLLMPETHEFDTLDDYLDYLAVSIQAVEMRRNYLLNVSRVGFNDEVESLQWVKMEVLEKYVNYHSGEMSFESKRDYYERMLNYALVMAHSEANELVDRDMHYHHEHDRYDYEYSSLKSKCDYLRNAKKKFEDSGEMDDYVLEIANRLESRYDHLY